MQATFCTHRQRARPRSSTSPGPTLQTLPKKAKRSWCSHLLHPSAWSRKTRKVDSSTSRSSLCRKSHCKMEMLRTLLCVLSRSRSLTATQPWISQQNRDRSRRPTRMRMTLSSSMAKRRRAKRWKDQRTMLSQSLSRDLRLSQRIKTTNRTSSRRKTCAM